MNKKLPPGFYHRATMYGMIAGVGMAAYLLVLTLLGYSASVGLSFLKHVVLFVVLSVAVNHVRHRMPEYKLFNTGMRMGAVVTVASGITLVVLNMLAYSISTSVILQSFATKVTGWRQLLVLEVAIFLEVLVFGGILTLCILQFLKRRG